MKYDKGLFSSSGEFDARKPFDFQGEHIAQGARFNWRRLNCGARKLRQLWDNGFIVPAGSLQQAPAGSPPNDLDLGDESRAEAEMKAKRVEAGKKSAEARKAKKAAAEAAAVNSQSPTDLPSGEPS